MYCECGCKKITTINKRTHKRNRVLQGHSPLKKLINYKGIDKWIEQNQNKHFCSCGCGGYIKVISHHFSRGIPKYIHGHYTNTPERKQVTREMNSARIGKLSPRWKENRDEIRGRIRCKVDFTKRQKRDIYLRDEGICQDCGIICLVDVDVNHPYKVNFDHIITVEDGGINEIENGQVLCLSCHKLKHSAIANRMNSGKPYRKIEGNPEPSVQSTKVQRLLEHSDMLNNQNSVRREIEQIVRNK